MIGVLYDGRLGNQLFQYAFAYTIAKKHRTYFYMDELRQNDCLREYFKLRVFEKTTNRFCRFLFQLHKEPQQVEFYNQFTQLNKNQFINPAFYKGYFQSDSYFDFDKKLKKYFSIKKRHEWQFHQTFGSLFQNNKTIVIHVRRTDYLSFGSNELGATSLVLPKSYYDKALASIIDIDSYQLIFISDDISFTKTTFGEKSNYYFSDNTEIIDFQFLMNADIAILANSSFSWWGAFLNEKTGKRIIVPEYWLGIHIQKEFPWSIIREEWEKITIM